MQDPRQIFEQSQKVIPGGVNSPVRAFAQVGITPPVIAKSASGATLVDCQGRSYLDYIGSWGPMILGHANPQVVAAVTEASRNGLSFGLATVAELELAQILIDAFPSMQMVRLTSSGTEATMTAVRLARGFTQKPGIVKFEGCYHGHFDSLLVKAGSGLATARSQHTSAPSSAGLIHNVEHSTHVVPFNDLAALQNLMQQHDDIAAVILEPVVGNMGCIPPEKGFLEGIRRLCDQHRVLMIMDEVMTGFRVAYGGAQQRYGVAADLTTLGKIIGGGMPMGAVGGKREIMQKIAPLGDVYQAGTLSGNPVSVAAGMATLRKLKNWRHPASHDDAYSHLEKLGQQLEQQLKSVLSKYAQQITLQRVGSMFTLFFNPGPLTHWQAVSRGDHGPNSPFARYYHAMLQAGILLPPSAFEAAFISLAHTEQDITKTANCMQLAIEQALAKQGRD